MEEELKALIEELEQEWEELTARYHSESPNTADYYLFLGKAEQLGSTIDKIKERFMSLLA